MSGGKPAPEERAQRMAEEDDRRPRLLGGDQAIERPEVADNLVPPALVGEMAEIGGGTARPVPAMIVGISPVACGVEGGGDTRVAGAVLGEAMGDLHQSARATFGEPTPPQEGLTVVGAKRELTSRHPRPSSWAPSLKRPVSHKKPDVGEPRPSSARGRRTRLWDRQIYPSQNRFGSFRSRVPWRGIFSSPAAWSPRLARVWLQRLWARFCRRAAIPSDCASSTPISMSIRAR